MKALDGTARDVCERALARTADAAARSTMITVTDERARREADRSDRRRRDDSLLGPLDGVPVAWKDLFDVSDTVTTCGSASLADRPPARADGTLVRRCAALGMVTVGKTNLSEFAFSGLGLNRHFGTPVNPVDPARAPGGSSSGSAVAVATGIASFALGTDTSGSVRVPAAFSGCVGYRASHHRYGPNDFRALSPILDSVGLLARSVEDVRLLDRLLAGTDGAAVPAVRRAVVPSGEWLEDCTPGIRASFEAAVDALRVEGVEIGVRRIDAMERAQYLMDVHGTIVGADAYAAYGALPLGSDVEPATVRRLASNADAPGAVAPVRAAMGSLREQFAAELAGAVLLCPTVRHEPPRIDDLRSDAAYDAINASTLRTTMVLSYLGACGVSLPMPGGGGMLVSAPAGDDEAVLPFAAVTERLIT